MSEVKSGAQSWFAEDAKDVFPPRSKRFTRGKKNSASLSLVRDAINNSSFDSLNPTEQRILQARFLTGRHLPATFGKIGEELGMSYSSARRATEKILEKLRKARG